MNIIKLDLLEDRDCTVAEAHGKHQPMRLLVLPLFMFVCLCVCYVCIYVCLHVGGARMCAGTCVVHVCGSQRLKLRAPLIAFFARVGRVSQLNPYRRSKLISLLQDPRPLPSEFSDYRRMLYAHTTLIWVLDI